MKILSMLPWVDWLAMGLFFGLWIGYAWFARINGTRNMTLIATTNHYRQLWMLQATARDPRMLDGLHIHHHHGRLVCTFGHNGQGCRAGS
jgi:uncharacterized membrane protein